MIELTQRYGLVAGVAALAWLLHHIVFSAFVGAARSKYGVEYPAMYASQENCKDAESILRFNCVQRAHQNGLESLAAFLALLLCAGLKFPIVAACFGLANLIGQAVYFFGYSSGSPNRRIPGRLVLAITTLGLAVICVWMAVDGFRG